MPILGDLDRLGFRLGRDAAVRRHHGVEQVLVLDAVAMEPVTDV